MEPERKTDPSLLSVLEELKLREPIFHRPELGTTRDYFERMIATEFWETGASGRRYSRAYVLDMLQERCAEPQHENWHCSDFHCQQLAENLFLLTYTLTQDQRKTRRSTIWRKTISDWQIVYHQGTVVQD